MSDEPFDESPVLDDTVTPMWNFERQRDEATRAVAAQEARDEANRNRAYILESIAISAELIQSWEQAYPTNERRGALYKAAAMKLANKVLTGEIEVGPAQVASVIRELSTAGRLEMGEATSSSESSQLSAEERKERLAMIREQVEAAERAAGASADVIDMGGAG